MHKVLGNLSSEKGKAGAVKERQADKRQKNHLVASAQDRELACSTANLTARAEVTKQRVEMVRLFREEDGVVPPLQCQLTQPSKHVYTHVHSLAHQVVLPEVIKQCT